MRLALTAQLAAAAFATLLASPAYAQSLPDIRESITQGGQIDDIIREQQNRSNKKAGEGEVIDGEAGVFVLQKNGIFFVGGGLSAGYESNPLRTVDDVGGSFLTSLAFTTGVQTVVAGRFDVGFSVNASGVEYDKNFASSSRSFHSGLSLGTQIGGSPIYASVQAFGGWNFDQAFSQGVAFYGASGALSAGIPLGRKTLLRPGIGVTRQWSQVSENNSISTAASLDIVHALTPRLTLAASGKVSRIWFDDFYEDATFVARKDWQYGGGMSLTYRLNDKVGLGLTGSYEKRSSSFFLAAYDGFDTSASLSLRVRF